MSNDDSENTAVATGQRIGELRDAQELQSGGFRRRCDKRESKCCYKPDLAVANADSNVSVLVSTSKKKRR